MAQGGRRRALGGWRRLWQQGGQAALGGRRRTRRRAGDGKRWRAGDGLSAAAFARPLELVLLLPDASASAGDDTEYLAAFPNPHLVVELAAFTSVTDAVRQAPSPSSAPQHDALIWEAIWLAEEDHVAAKRNIAAWVREMGERLDTLSLADVVELVCVLRRVEEGAAASPPPD